MNHVIALRERVRSAEQSMNDRFQVLRTDRGKTHQPDAIVFCQVGSEVVAAIDRDFVAHLHQSLSDLLVIGLNSAIFRDHSPAADKGYPQATLLNHCKRLVPCR